MAIFLAIRFGYRVAARNGAFKISCFLLQSNKTRCKKTGDPRGPTVLFARYFFQGRRPQADAFSPQRALGRGAAPPQGDAGKGAGRHAPSPPPSRAGTGPATGRRLGKKFHIRVLDRKFYMM